ncbi:hypothetical protein [Bacillus sp. FJAT-47783]|uniref:hypothetical protein n=1 Tax=Bacillus sp. FJAT-47783 TaxID=2922712 RepID=UPI001FAD4977|nr:hypothetical protein [Bacillus sp. FJAT-47783]
MIFTVRLLQGIFHPFQHFIYFSRASTIHGFRRRFFFIMFLFLLLGCIRAYFGMGTEEFMREWDAVSTDKIEVAKIVYGLGEIIQSILYPLAFMLLFSTTLTLYVDELPFKKLWVIQLYAVMILFIEKTLSTAIYYYFGIFPEWNVFSLGPIVHLVTDYPLLIILASKTTVFHLWAAFIQLVSIKISSKQSYVKLIPCLLLLHFLFISIDAISTALLQDLDIVL